MVFFFLCSKYVIYHIYPVHYKAKQFLLCVVQNHPEHTHTSGSVLNNAVDRRLRSGMDPPSVRSWTSCRSTEHLPQDLCLPAAQGHQKACKAESYKAPCNMGVFGTHFSSSTYISYSPPIGKPTRRLCSHTSGRSIRVDNLSTLPRGPLLPF